MAQPTVLDTPRDTQEDGSVAVEQPAKRLKRTCHLADPLLAPEVIPKEFMAKWIATPKGILPFVKNMETDLVHCGYTRMKVLHFKSELGAHDYRSVVCMSGCSTNACQTVASPDCDCVCHILQKDYDSRATHG